MSNDAQHWLTDEFGRVFHASKADGTTLYKGLHVSALLLRIADQILKEARSQTVLSPPVSKAASHPMALTSPDGIHRPSQIKTFDMRCRLYLWPRIFRPRSRL